VSPAGGGGESATRDGAVAAEDAPDPTADELVARAAAMRDTLRARQAECEALGRLADATNDEYIDAGFFRVLQPRRFGGYELGLEAFLRIAPNPGRPVVDFPGRSVHENAIYRGGSIIPLLVSEPAAVAVLQTRHQYGPASPLRRELSMFQRDLGRATALVDTAEAALMQVATSWTRQAHDAVERGIPITVHGHLAARATECAI
jgi:hypothetical protein